MFKSRLLITFLVFVFENQVYIDTIFISNCLSMLSIFYQWFKNQVLNDNVNHCIKSREKMLILKNQKLKMKWLPNNALIFGR